LYLSVFEQPASRVFFSALQGEALVLRGLLLVLNRDKGADFCGGFPDL
jgi:hypothetical protein